MKMLLIAAALVIGGPAQALCMVDGCEGVWREDERRRANEMLMHQMQTQASQRRWEAQMRHDAIMDAHRRQQFQLEQLNQQLMNQTFNPSCGVGMPCR